MKTIVFSLGGSLIVPDKINVDFLKSFKNLVLDLVRKDYRAVIVTGGGSICRKYNDSAKELGEASDEDLDRMGIAATKLNAELIRIMFGDYAHEMVLKNPTKEIETDKRIIVASGYKPGNSSDKVAVMLAHKFSADNVINMTNIERVYDSDPKTNRNARALDEVSWDEFLQITGDEWSPGKNVPFDPVASKLARDNCINVVILRGSNLDNLREYLLGNSFTGTIIK